MKKHNLHTTLSSKHWELLNKYREKFETQQKVLEFALENLENNPRQNPSSPVDQYWINLVKARKLLIVVHRDLFIEFIKTADPDKIIEAIIHLKLAKYVLESYYGKPLKNCNLKEVLDGMVIIGEIANWFDEIKYVDNGSHYILKMVHSLGINNSKINKAIFEDLFKEYEIKTETYMTDTGLFVKVYKNISDKVFKKLEETPQNP